jgi:hypothetical protein
MVGVRVRQDQPTNVREFESNRTEGSLQVVEFVPSLHSGIPGTTINEDDALVVGERVCIHAV